MRCLLSVGIVVGLAGTARADDVLTLPRVMAAAIRQNPDLEQTSIDVTLATAAYQRALGVGDTHLGFTADASASRDKALSAVDKNELAQVALAFTASRLLPTGGTLS